MTSNQTVARDDGGRAQPSLLTEKIARNCFALGDHLHGWDDSSVDLRGAYRTAVLEAMDEWSPEPAAGDSRLRTALRSFDAVDWTIDGERHRAAFAVVDAARAVLSAPPQPLVPDPTADPHPLIVLLRETLDDDDATDVAQALLAGGWIVPDGRVGTFAAPPQAPEPQPTKVCSACGATYIGDDHFHVEEPYEGCSGEMTGWVIRGDEADLVAEAFSEDMARFIVGALNAGRVIEPGDDDPAAAAAPVGTEQ